MVFAFFAFTLITTFSVEIIAAEKSFEATKIALEKAMQADLRSEKEKARDENRMPVETLEFFGFRKDMKAIELFPGGGWYTKLLAPALKNQGKFYVALGTGRVENKLLGEKGFEKVTAVDTGAKMNRNPETGFYNISEFDFAVNNVDMVLTFRNYHNFDKASRQIINAEVFKALKPGGVFAVVDHTRRHMQALDKENIRRVDPVLAIKEIQQAGFKFVDYSDLHYRADDELRYEVGRKTVTENTDRFTLKFVKPK